MNRLPQSVRGFGVVVTAAFVSAVSAPAIPPGFPLADLVHDRWTTRDGLPVSEVDKIVVSRSGYLWLATEEGLVRFDGTRFAVFNRQTDPGLPAVSINAVWEDESGALWIGTREGLAVGRGQHLVPVPLDPSARPVVNAIVPDGGSGVWVGTDAGLYRVDRHSNRGLREPRLGSTAIGALAPDGEGGVWAGTSDALVHLTGGQVIRCGERADFGAPVHALLREKDGVLWIGARGLFRLQPGAARPELVPGSENLRVSDLLRDRDEVLWVASEAGLFRQLASRFEPIQHPAGTDPLCAQSLATDRDGSIWFGTVGAGLQRLRIGAAATIGKDRGLSSDMVNAVLEGRDGTLWIATSVGLDHVRGGIVGHEMLPLRPGCWVNALHEDRRGRLWVGTDEETFRREADGWRVMEAEPGVDISRMRALATDGDGVVWAGGQHGLFQFVGERFRQAAHMDGQPMTQPVYSLAPAPDGTVWVASRAGVGPVEKGRFRPLPGTLPGYGVSVAKDGTVWAGQDSGGIVRIRGSELVRFTHREGLVEDSFTMAIEDRRGNLWLSSNHGVLRVSLQELGEVAAGRAGTVHPVIYGASDGMGDRECNGTGSPAAWLASDGRIWFPTIKGATVFDPGRDEPLPPPPRVVIEEIWVDGTRLGTAPELRLPPGTRSVTISYTGLALAAPDRLRFRRRLTGLDDQENDVGTARTVQYAGLPHGRYVFSVRAVRERGVASDRPAELAFVIAPHFWQTRWFLAAVLAMAVAAVAAADRLRQRAARQREIDLRRRVDEEMAKVKVLTGLLPTCAWCNQIRDENGAWHPMEQYVAERSQAKFTHGMCPACAARFEQEHRL